MLDSSQRRSRDCREQPGRTLVRPVSSLCTATRRGLVCYLFELISNPFHEHCVIESAFTSRVVEPDRAHLSRFSSASFLAT